MNRNEYFITNLIALSLSRKGYDVQREVNLDKSNFIADLVAEGNNRATGESEKFVIEVRVVRAGENISSLVDRLRFRHGIQFKLAFYDDERSKLFADDFLISRMKFDDPEVKLLPLRQSV